MINSVRLDQSCGDGPAQQVVILLQLRLPEGGVPVLAEVLLGPVASRGLPGAILLAEHCHSIQAIVADVVAGDMGQAGRHHPHTTALISWDSERSWSLRPSDGRGSTLCLPKKGSRKGAGLETESLICKWPRTSHFRAWLQASPSYKRGNNRSVSQLQSFHGV